MPTRLPAVAALAAAALSTQAGEARFDADHVVWTVNAERFFPASTKDPGGRPLTIHLVRRAGAWTACFAVAPKWNGASHAVDASAATATADKLTGALAVELRGDGWIPQDGRPVACRLDIDATAQPGAPGALRAVAGTWTGSRGGEAVQGPLTGHLAPPDPEPAQDATLTLLLFDAFTGGKERWQDRIWVSIPLRGGSAARAEFASVGMGSKPFDHKPVAACQVAATADGFTGTIAIPHQILGSTAADPSATYHVELHALRFGASVGGSALVRVVPASGAESAKTVAVRGTLGPPAKEEPSLFAAELSPSRPWFTPVPGFVAPAPGEHPRLFFRQADLPRLKARAATPLGQKLVARLRATLGGGEAMPTVYSPATEPYPRSHPGMPEGAYTISHAAGFGMLWQLTGNAKYADLARQCFEKAWAGVHDRDPRYSWLANGGELRAGPTLGWYALGYDLCYDAWDEAFRQKVARAIQDYEMGPLSATQEVSQATRTWGSPDKGFGLKSMCLTPEQMPACNHWGSTVGGAGLAVLAILGDPGTDAAKLKPYLDRVLENNVRNLYAGWGDGGFYAEGWGAGHMASCPAFVPFMQAARNVLGQDYRAPRPNLDNVTLHWVWHLIGDGSANPRFPIRGTADPSYGSSDLIGNAGGGVSHGGWFSQGFGAIADRARPALLWTYEKLCAKADRELCDTRNYPHRCILALVNWPIDEPVRNPAEVLPRTLVDRVHGYFAFRNRWQDGDDTLVTVYLHSGPDGNYNGGPTTTMVWSHGQQLKWGGMPRGQASHYEAHADGSGVVAAAGASIAIDFRGVAGAPVVIVASGSAAAGEPKDLRGTYVRRQLGGTPVAALILGAATPPAAELDGERLVIGGAAYALKDGRLVLGAR